MEENRNHKIILFDGVCNLCNSSVIFVIKRDKKDVFRFSALQEGAGPRLVQKYGIDTRKTDSIILIENGKAYVKSTAALRIARNLGGAYPLLFGFMILPNFLRNWVYDFIARNRYKWYGKKESCMIPTPELKSKFLS
ncbi:MAG: thiol-disulfide oxidoreductase DCC family protein [Bacteroidota bacterium]